MNHFQTQHQTQHLLSKPRKYPKIFLRASLISGCIAGVLFFLPQLAFASIEIQEIMYDHEGADAGFEWVEVYNASSDSIDISSWYFYENETHHGLTPDGFTSLGPGERALIVQNLENIYGEYGSSLKLIKSSFSLNNTGESLSMSNENKEIQSTVQYSSDYGATGNGFSLQWNGSVWIEAEPTPGAVNADVNQQPPNSSSGGGSSNTTRVTSEQEKNVHFDDYYTGYVYVPSNIVSGSPVTIEAYVTHTTRRDVVKKIRSGNYYLNFGDGSFVESDERIDIDHIYEYPGEYQLVFEFYRSTLAKNSEEPPKVTVRKTVKVHENSIELIAIDSASAITIKNLTNIDVNLEGWDISDGTKEYTFPRYSYIEAGKTLVIPAKAHGHAPLNYNDWIVLRNEKNVGVSSFTKNSSRIGNSQTSHSPELEKISIPLEASVVQSMPKGNLERFLDQHPEKQYADFTDTDIQSISSSASSSESSLPILPTVAIGVIALILIIVRKQYTPSEKVSDDVNKVIGEIELIE